MGNNKTGVEMMPNRFPVWRLSLTPEERIWIHKIADKKKSNLSSLVITILDEMSKKLGIPLPTHRVNRVPYRMAYGLEGRKELIKDLTEEL